MAFPRLFLPVLVSAALSLGSGALADGLPWSASYDAAQTLSKSSGKPMLVDVYTDWCVWCKKLDTDIYPQPAVVKAAALFVPVRINAEKEGQSVAAKYHVTGYPTLLFLSSDGTLISKITGYEEADAFAADLTRIEEENREFPAWQDTVKADPADHATALKLALAYVHRERLADAQALTTTLETGDKTMLGPLYNALAGAQLDQGQTAAAMTLYQKTVAVSKVDSELIPAHIGLFQLYSQKKDLPQMKVQLQALAALPGTPVDLKTRVKAVLAQLNAQTPTVSPPAPKLHARKPHLHKPSKPQPQ
jgi:thioredoxin-like negative regulator of GroEL